MRIALLISGGGTTAAAIIAACQSGLLKGAQPVLVIASKPEAGGIQKAVDLGIFKKDVLIIQPKDFKTSANFGKAIINECKKRQVEFVGQYGWLAKTPANVIQEYQNMMTNQHPGPLDPGRPDFGGQGMYGKRVHCARLEFVKRTERDFWSEATAQRVAEKFDEGAALCRQRVEILPNDSPEDLAARMLPFEHEVQIKILQDFALGKVAEIMRSEPLVRPEEYGILEECKKIAIKKYPKG